MNVVRTIEQKRSEFALKCVNEVTKDKDVRGNYKGLVKKFPMMVLRNGLLQTIAFLEAKGRREHRILLDHLKTYLESESPLGLKLENSSLSKYLSETDVSWYRNITADVLTFAKWLGRYAEALIEEEAREE